MILPALFALASSMTSVPSPPIEAAAENTYSIEGRLGAPAGIGISAGLSPKPNETYFLKMQADGFIQAAMATVGLHYQTFYSGPHYIEYGLGAFALGLDENLRDDKGSYIGLAFGRRFTGPSDKIHFGIEWTQITILASTKDQNVFPIATLPRLTIGTKF